MKRLLSTEEVQNLLLNVMIVYDKFCRENNLKYYLIGGSLLGAVRHNGFIPWDDDMDVGMIRDDYEMFLKKIDSFPSQYEIKNYRNSKNCDYVITRIYINNTYIDNPIVKNNKLDHRLYFDVFPLDYVPDDLTIATKHSKHILSLKRLLAYVDVKNNGNNKLILIVKGLLASVLRIFRNSIIRSLEHEMMKYCDTNHICSLASQYSYKKQYFASDIYGIPIEYLFCGYHFLGPEKPENYLSQLYGSDFMLLPPLEKRRKGWDIYISE